MARGQPMGQLLTTSITGTAYPRRPIFDLIDAVAPGEAGVRITDARCGSFQRRDALDLNQCTQRETGDCNCGPRRRVGWEVFRVNLVHDGNWHNVAARTKDGREGNHRALSSLRVRGDSQRTVAHITVQENRSFAHIGHGASARLDNSLHVVEQLTSLPFNSSLC